MILGKILFVLIHVFIIHLQYNSACKIHIIFKLFPEFLPKVLFYKTGMYNFIQLITASA